MATNLKEQENGVQNPGDEHMAQLVANSQGLADAEQQSDGTADSQTNSPQSLENNTGNPQSQSSGKKKSGTSGPRAQNNTLKSSKATPSGNSKFGKALNFAKKSGPLGPIILIFVISFAALMIMFAPGLALVQLKEIITGDLNDTFGNLELRKRHILKAKLKGKPLSGLCTQKLSYRCKFKSMSLDQIERLELEGIKVHPDPRDPASGSKRTLKGRYKVDGLSYVDGNGNAIDIDAKNLNRAMRNSPDLGQKLNRGLYDADWQSWRGKIAMGMFKRVKASLNRLLNGTDAQMRKQMDDAVNKGSEIDINKSHVNYSEDENGRLKAEDTRTGAELDADSVADADTAGKQHIAKARNNASPGMTSYKTGLGALNVIYGGQQMACGVLGMLDAASIAARLLGNEQMIRFFVVFANTSDSIPFGGAAAEAVEWMGKQVVHVDTRRKVAFGERSFGEGQSNNIMDNIKSMTSADQVSPAPNDQYGKNAFDSTSVKTLMHGYNEPLNMRESQYVSGISGSGIDTLVSLVRTFVPGINKPMCNFTESFAGQALGIGIAVAYMAVTATSLGAAAGAMAQSLPSAIAGMVAMWFINSKVEDLFNGVLADGNTKGVDFGAAASAGGAAAASGIASANGILPVSNMEDVANMAYVNHIARVDREKIERYAARNTPLDIYNQYSFLGSIIRSADLTSLYGMGKIQAALLMPIKILGSVSSTLTPKTFAQAAQTDERFGQCKDPFFVGGRLSENSNEFDKGIGLKTADIWCNIRHSNNPIHLNADPERVADWMVDAAQVDPESGEPIVSAEDMVRLNEPSNRTSAAAVDAAPSGEDPSKNSNEPPVKVYPESTSYILRQTVADVLRPDDDTLADLGIPINTPSDKLVAYTPGYKYRTELANTTGKPYVEARFYPPPINPSATSQLLSKEPEGTEREKGDNRSKNYEPEKDARTYAHWYRFCRDGAEDGRKVPIGIPDSEDPEDLLSKVAFGLIGKNYVSDGRECLRENRCEAGQDPNGANHDTNIEAWYGEGAMKKRCYPPQYDIYSAYLLDKHTDEGMEGDEDAE